MIIALAFSLLTFAYCESEVAIVVNGDKIYKDEYDYALSKYEDSYKRYFGEDHDEATMSRMKKELIEDLIERQLYIEEAVRRGINAKVFAGEEEIEELVMKDPIFYTDGKFDVEKSIRLNLESSRELKHIRDRAESVILADKIREILPSKVIAVLKEDVSVDDKEVVDEYLNRSEKMRVRYIKVDPSAIANNMGITEDEIKTYFNQHAEDFRRPAVKKYAVLFFDPEDYAGMVSVSDKMLEEYYLDNMDELRTKKQAKAKFVLFRVKDYVGRIYQPGVNLRQYYEGNIEKYVQPAEARVRFIFIKKPCTDEKILALADDLKRGADFAGLAREYSDDPTSVNGGDLGYIKEGTLKEPFNGIAFNLESGEVSGLIETDKGFSVLAVQDIKDERLREFDEVKGEIEQQLLYEAAKPLALSEAKRFKIEAKKLGFEEAADNKRLPVYETDYFRSGDRIPMIGKNALFTSLAMSLSSGEVGGEVEFDGGYAVLKVEDKKLQEYPQFSEVSKEVEARVIKENSSAYAESAAKHALSLLEEKTPLSDLGKKINVHISEYELPSTLEASADPGKIKKADKGYSITLFLGETPSYIPNIDQVASEVSASAAMDKADIIAKANAENILQSGAITGEAATETAPFARADYVIGTEYMKPFIEQCFQLRAGATAIVKSLGKYYVVQVLEKNIKLSGFEEESQKLRSQVLMEKRSSYVKDWLKKERERAEIQINI